MNNPRQRRHKVAIQYLVAGSPAQKPSGERDEVWTDYLSDVSASIEPLRGRELYVAQEHHAEVDTRINIRYRAGIDSTMRVIHESRTYNILAVLDWQTRHVELELMCKLDPQQPDVATGSLLLEDVGVLLLQDVGALVLE